MKALYTRLFSDFLNEYGETPEWTAIREKFEQFPVFSIDGLNLNMYELFVDRYEIREIGSETDSIFLHHVNDTLNELLIKYVPKINLFIDSFNDSMQRIISLNDNRDYTDFLNPVNGAASGETKRVIGASDENRTYDRAILTFKTNPEILSAAFNVRDIYNDCLLEFDSLFMGIY